MKLNTMKMLLFATVLIWLVSTNAMGNGFAQNNVEDYLHHVEKKVSSFGKITFSDANATALPDRVINFLNKKGDAVKSIDLSTWFVDAVQLEDGSVSVTDKQLVLGMSDSNDITIDLTDIIELSNKNLEASKSDNKTLTLLDANGTKHSVSIDGWFDNFYATGGILDLDNNKLTIVNEDPTLNFDIDITDLTDALKEVGKGYKEVGLSTDNKTMTFTRVNGETVDLDVSGLEKDTYITDGVLNGEDGIKTITLTDNYGKALDVNVSLIQDALDDKVDKVDGKALSTNDLTDALKDAIGTKKVKDTSFDDATNKIVVTYTDDTTSVLTLKEFEDTKLTAVSFDDATKKISYTVGDNTLTLDVSKLALQADVDTALDTKVDKVAGKGLSTNDLTDALKTLVETKKVKDTTYDLATNKITITYTDDTTAELTLKEFTDTKLTAISFDDATKKISYTVGDNTLELDITKLALQSDLDTTNTAVDDKVDKEDGKALSTNDLTDALKDAIEAKKVSDTTYDDTTNKITVTYTDGTTSELSLSEATDTKLTAVSFDDATQLISYTVGDDTLELNVSKLALQADVDTALDTKVDKVAGKGLSTNDLTDALKDAIEAKKVADIVGDSDNGELDVTYTDGSTASIAFSELVGDKFLNGGTLSLVDKKITYTVSGGDDVIVDLTDLFDEIDDHKENTSNPHHVSKAQVGLAHVDDTSDADKPVSDDTQTALDDKVDKVSGKGLSTNDLTNALKTLLKSKKVKEIVGDEDNGELDITYTDDTTSFIVLSDLVPNKYANLGTLSLSGKKITIKVKDGDDVVIDLSDLIDSINNHIDDKGNPHEVTKAQVGLGNVDNTSDANKPISTATQDALDDKVDKVAGKELSSNDLTDALKDAIGTKKVSDIVGDATNHELDVTYTDGTTASINVDNLVTDATDKYADGGTFSLSTKKITITVADGTDVVINLTDLVNLINNHIDDKGNPHEVTKAQVGLGNVDNTSDANKPISTATQDALDDKVDKVSGKGLSSNDFTNSYKDKVNADRVINVIDSSLTDGKIVIDYRDASNKNIQLNHTYYESVTYSHADNGKISDYGGLGGTAFNVDKAIFNGYVIGDYITGDYVLHGQLYIKLKDMTDTNEMPTDAPITFKYALKDEIVAHSSVTNLLNNNTDMNVGMTPIPELYDLPDYGGLSSYDAGKLYIVNNDFTAKFESAGNNEDEKTKNKNVVGVMIRINITIPCTR